MLFLIDDVLLNLLQIRLAHRKACVTTLPGKIFDSIFHPNAGNALEFFHPIRLRNRATKTRQHVNVILYAAGNEWRALQLL